MRLFAAHKLEEADKMGGSGRISGLGPGHLGKPFIHFFLVGEQLLDARALLHALEMRRDVGEAGEVHLQLGGTSPDRRSTFCGLPLTLSDIRAIGGSFVKAHASEVMHH